MNINTFNLLHQHQLRIVVGYREDLRIVQQWCPIAKIWSRIPGSLLDYGRSHFSIDNSTPSDYIPEHMVRATEEYANNAYSAKCILVIKGKHDDVYYDASTTESLGRACIKTLIDNRDSGCYQVWEQDPQAPTYDLESLQQFDKNSIVYKAGVDEISKYKNKIKRINDSISFLEEVNTAIKNMSYFDAFKLLDQRSSSEYERIELVRCCKVVLEGESYDQA